MAEDSITRSISTAQLVLVIVANVTAYYCALQAGHVFGGNWPEALADMRAAVPAGLGAGLVGVVNALLPPHVKAQVIFLRRTDPLPGARAFTHHAPSDPRIDISRLEAKYGALPSDPRRQNELWYRIYRSVRMDPAVMHVHRAYLFTRDYACLALMLMGVLGVLGFVQFTSKGSAFVYLSLLLVQFALVRLSARNHGLRFVTTVLAIDVADSKESS